MEKSKVSKNIDIHCLGELCHKVFWAFDHLEDDVKNRFKPSDIATFLIEEKGIKIIPMGGFIRISRNKNK